MADYLASYAERFELPLSSGCRVEALRRSAGTYIAGTTGGEIRARSVVVASGAHQRPSVPDLGRELAAVIEQLHSSSYRSPEAIADGPVLVVGAGASGAEIALELAHSGREVTLAGPAVSSLPGSIAGRDLYWWLYATRILRARCDRPPGSWLCRYAAHGGDQLVGIGRREFARAGVRRAGRISSVRDGLPVPEGTAPLPSRTVIWCTGYEPAFDEWLRLPVLGADGDLPAKRGVVTAEPGLFTVGRPFQCHPDSGLVGGVGVDAASVADRIEDALR